MSDLAGRIRWRVIDVARVVYGLEAALLRRRDVRPLLVSHHDRVLGLYPARPQVFRQDIVEITLFLRKAFVAEVRFAGAQIDLALRADQLVEVFDHSLFDQELADHVGADGPQRTFELGHYRDLDTLISQITDGLEGAVGNLKVLLLDARE